LVYAGFALSIVALIVSQTLLNVVIVALYAAQFIIFRLLSKKTKREWGYVYNSKNGAKIKGAFVRIYDTVLTRQVEVIITDEQGRYMFNNLKEGNYLISVYSEGYTFPAQSQSNLNLTYSQTGQAFVKVSVLKGKPINLIIPLDPLSPSAVRSGPFGS